MLNPSLTRWGKSRTGDRTCITRLTLPNPNYKPSLGKAQHLRKFREHGEGEEFGPGEVWEVEFLSCLLSVPRKVQLISSVSPAALCLMVSLQHQILYLWITNLLTFDICISFHLINRSSDCQRELLWKISTAMGMPKRSLNHIRKTMCS